MSQDALSAIVAKAKAVPGHIVLPEGADERIVAGGLRAAREQIARITFLGEPDKDPDDCGGWAQFVDPVSSDRLGDYANAFHDLRKHKGVSRSDAEIAVRDPLVFAAMMVRYGDADGTVGGAAHPTADVLRPALQIIGRADGAKTVSSFFLMMLDEARHGSSQTLVFADCALVVDPDVETLADITLSSAGSRRKMLGDEPRVAMLSFSTKGSARHARVDTVTEALERVRSAQPDLKADGELQFDAAYVDAIGRSKAPGSDVAGHANVFVFPNLEAGNIGYKIAQRIGGATAVGPILQGLAKPANDLSRGCSADDVYHLIAVTSVQASALTNPSGLDLKSLLPRFTAVSAVTLASTPCWLREPHAMWATCPHTACGKK